MSRLVVLVAGAEASGNRLMAGLLVSAGFWGSGSTEQVEDLEDLPEDALRMVLIRHQHIGTIARDLMRRDRDLNVYGIMMVRDTWAHACSAAHAGHFPNAAAARAIAAVRMGEALEGFLGAGVKFSVVTYEGLVARPYATTKRLIKDMVDEGEPFEAPLMVDLKRTDVFDANSRWYGDEPPKRWQWAGELVWFPERGYGWYPANPAGVYGDEYFEKYVGYAQTEMGRQLTEARVRLVQKHVGSSPVVDIGIGCGAFVESRGGSTWGFDVNPAGVAWLEARGRFLDPRVQTPRNVTCWDSLEHLVNPAALVERVPGYVFLSIPIFTSAEDVLASRHFRKDEHYHYWTEPGLVAWFEALGFELVDKASFETDLGRGGIGTYVFRRRRAL